MTCGMLFMSSSAMSDDFLLSLRRQEKSETSDHQYVRTTKAETWSPAETAVIVCDVWDKHHSINAVRRMEEFLPRMNDVLKEARRKGSIIIHSPSDCMPAYEGHAARQRATEIPAAKVQPADIEFWCSKIPAEEQAVYPIDQSDGGDDDEPTEHAKWAAELKTLGRNPGLPWKSQNAGIEIHEQLDFISDKGDEVWNILESRGIKNVILVGVHTNMCVLGRPFGLRQLARNGKNVVLMRDLTDCMYNPKSWPYVDHFTGNDLIISHVERFVCPTITSDQILGGKPFASQYDKRKARDVMSPGTIAADNSSFNKHWTTAIAGASLKEASHGVMESVETPIWHRCTVRIPAAWLSNSGLQLVMADNTSKTKAWLNGKQLETTSDGSHFGIPRDAVFADDINLLVIRNSGTESGLHLLAPPLLQSGDRSLKLAGRWQFRIGDDESLSNIPLPAKFGIGSDVLFEVQ
jgi:nicotinamidase-related amidase